MTVKVIALAGGPCAGKSTGIVEFYEWLLEAGCGAVIVPEVATRLITAGVKPALIKSKPDSGEEDYARFQREILLAQVFDEEMFKRLALLMPRRDKEPTIVVCDRGAPDIYAYCDADVADRIVEEAGFSRAKLLERYFGVIHLVTAADGAEPFYTLANNPARNEKTIEEARALDKKTQEAWLGHPKLSIVNNSTDFAGKMRRAIAVFQRLVGLPVATQVQRKFYLSEMPHLSRLPPFQEFEIEQAWLPEPDGIEHRIRQRSWGNLQFHTRTIMLPTSDLRVRNYREERILLREYRRLLQHRLFPGLEPVRKRRYCFALANQYFRLDCFTSPRHLVGRALLELEPTEESGQVQLPDFAHSAIEVSDDARYKNRFLCELGFPNGKSPAPTAKTRWWPFRK